MLDRDRHFESAVDGYPNCRNFNVKKSYSRAPMDGIAAAVDVYMSERKMHSSVLLRICRRRKV